jgi:hypothetical protein
MVKGSLNLGFYVHDVCVVPIHAVCDTGPLHDWGLDPRGIGERHT